MPPQDRRETSDSPTTYRDEDGFVLVDEDVEWDGDQTKYTPATPLQDAALNAKAAAKATWANCSWDNVRQVAGAAAEVGDALFGGRQEQRRRVWKRDGDSSRDADGLRNGSGGVGKMGTMEKRVQCVSEIKRAGKAVSVVKSREDLLVEEMLEAELEDLSAGRVFVYGLRREEKQDEPLGVLWSRRPLKEVGTEADRMCLVREAADSYAHDAEDLPGPAQPRYPRPQTRRGCHRDEVDFEPAELNFPRQLLPVEKSEGGKQDRLHLESE